MISTGSKSMDSLLGGGIRAGMVTDVYGESGSGKSQLCFTLCANCVRDGGTVIFVDTAGTFRPERIVDISGSQSVLEKIAFSRAMNTIEQISVIRKIFATGPRLVIIDTLTSLFSSEYSGPARHLAVMKHMHELAIAAINSGSAIVVTNMIRNVPTAGVDHPEQEVMQTLSSSTQREYLSSSVSIYSHVKVKLEIESAARSTFKSTLMQPAGKNPVSFSITSKGISDLN